MCAVNKEKSISIIGAGILDILAGPVDSSVFSSGSMPMEHMKLSFGGDALNETLALSRLGRKPELITKLGDDEAGNRILSVLKERHLSTKSIQIEKGLETGINIVLVDKKGERHFLTNPSSSLRTLSENDIFPHLDACGEIVSFASMFVSSSLSLNSMEHIFQKIKEQPERILVADMTKAKKGENLEDLRPLFPYIDFLLPNEEELALLTGESDPYKNAESCIQAGLSCIVIKRGAKGCLIQTPEIRYEIPAIPVIQAIDSTGAGDCFAAGFLWALSNDWSLEECGRFACAAASCSIETVGATDGILSLDQVLTRYSASSAASVSVFPVRR